MWRDSVDCKVAKWFLQMDNSLCLTKKMMYNYNHTWYLSLTAWVKKFPTGHKVSPQVKHHKPSLFHYSDFFEYLHFFEYFNFLSNFNFLTYHFFLKIFFTCGMGGYPLFPEMEFPLFQLVSPDCENWLWVTLDGENFISWGYLYCLFLPKDGIIYRLQFHWLVKFRK